MTISFKKIAKAYRILRQSGPREFVRRLKARLRHQYAAQRWQYRDFLRAVRPTAAELERQRATHFAYRPRFGVVIPLYKTKPEYLRDLLDSFQSQTYANFKLFMVDASPVNNNKTILTDFMHAEAQKDSRIIYEILPENAGIAANTNQAIALAMRDPEITHIGLCDHDDFLEPDALFQYAKVLNTDKNVKIIYSDEDVTKGPNDPNAYYIMKPDFSPFLLESCNYINHFFVCEKTLLEKIKTQDGLYERPEFDGAQDYDLYLRLAEEALKLDQKLKAQASEKIKSALYTSSTIYHVPRVLYHWRAADNSTAQDPQNKLYAFDAGKRALEAYYSRCDIDISAVEHTDIWGTYRTKYYLKHELLVSVIIPQDKQSVNIEKLVSSIRDGTYRNLEFIANGCNYNDSVKYAHGDILLFLSGDIEMLASDSISEMVAILERDQVGAVGAQILFRNGELQHAGLVVGLESDAGHIFQHLRPEFSYANRANCVTNYSAVSADCLLVKKSTYEQVGGFDETLPAPLSDIDLCLKIRALGDFIVYTPHAKFRYHGHKKYNPAHKIERLRTKWPEIYRHGDPYYNPNFSLQKGNCDLRYTKIMKL